MEMHGYFNVYQKHYEKRGGTIYHKLAHLNKAERKQFINRAIDQYHYYTRWALTHLDWQTAKRNKYILRWWHRMQKYSDALPEIDYFKEIDAYYDWARSNNFKINEASFNQYKELS